MKTILIGLLLVSIQASALDLRLTTLNVSHHFSEKGLNETHNGIGMEVKYSDVWYGINHYTNSYNYESNLVYFSYKTNLVFDIEGEVLLGTASGYKGKEYTTMGAFGMIYNYVRVFVTPDLIGLGMVFDL